MSGIGCDISELLTRVSHGIVTVCSSFNNSNVWLAKMAVEMYSQLGPGLAERKIEATGGL